MKNVSYFVTSFIEIARCVSDGLLICDANTTIEELVTEDFDCFDFETALCCFEATHHVSFKSRVWESDFSEFKHMTIEEFIETHAEHKPQRDPLFVTRRFLLFKEMMFDLMQNCGNEGCCEEKDFHE